MCHELSRVEAGVHPNLCPAAHPVCHAHAGAPLTDEESILASSVCLGGVRDHACACVQHEARHKGLLPAHTAAQVQVHKGASSSGAAAATAGLDPHVGQEHVLVHALGGMNSCRLHSCRHCHVGITTARRCSQSQSGPTGRQAGRAKDAPLIILPCYGKAVGASKRRGLGGTAGCLKWPLLLSPPFCLHMRWQSCCIADAQSGDQASTTASPSATKNLCSFASHAAEHQQHTCATQTPAPTAAPLSRSVAGRCAPKTLALFSRDRQYVDMACCCPDCDRGALLLKCRELRWEVAETWRLAATAVAVVRVEGLCMKEKTSLLATPTTRSDLYADCMAESGPAHCDADSECEGAGSSAR